MATKEVATTPTTANEIAAFQETNLNVQEAAAYSTIKADSLAKQVTIATMLNAAESLNGHEGEIFTIVDVFFKPGVRQSRNGQPDQPCTDTYLLTKDNHVYFTKSAGIAKSVRNILMMIPDLNKPNGIDVLVDYRQLANGNDYKTLVPQPVEK